MGMTTQSTLPRLLNTTELSDYLGVPARSIEAWRNRAGGPPFVRFGRQVWYPENALVPWLDEYTKNPAPQ